MSWWEMSLKHIIIAVASVATVVSAESSSQKPRELPKLEIILDRDLIRVQDIVPTSYWIETEKGFPCTGNYNGRNYTGQERARVLDKGGKVIDTVCGRFYAALLMEGTGIIDINGSPFTVNIESMQDGKAHFKGSEGCKYGIGINDKCLLPFYTVAADLSPKTPNHWNEGDIIYAPQLKGAVLPDGSRHQGFFVVRDTGGKFDGKGRTDRLDFFVGESKNRKFWDGKKFNPEGKFVAYRVEGESKRRAHAWLEQNFGNLYTGRAR